MRINRHVAQSRQHNGVAVGLRACGQSRANRAACATFVLDNDRLPPSCIQTLRNSAGNDIGASARWKRNDHSDRLIRIRAGYCLRGGWAGLLPDGGAR